MLAEAEQLHGIVFDAESMAFDEDICKHANLPDSIYFDTMHNVCASGGFAQYEVNQFCRRVKEHGYRMEMLDSWYSCIHSPRQGYAKLSKHWFSKRISDASDRSHCQAYASEMLTVVSVLSCFADEWLTPQGFMPAEICCLKKLELMLDIFFHTIMSMSTFWKKRRSLITKSSWHFIRPVSRISRTTNYMLLRRCGGSRGC